LRERGTRRLVASVLAENSRMLDLARELGFTLAPTDLREGTRQVALEL
jgi:RimJ/RimL family protein N-acetyltransferase